MGVLETYTKGLKMSYRKEKNKKGHLRDIRKF